MIVLNQRDSSPMFLSLPKRQDYFIGNKDFSLSYLSVWQHQNYPLLIRSLLEIHGKCIAAADRAFQVFPVFWPLCPSSALSLHSSQSDHFPSGFSSQSLLLSPGSGLVKAASDREACQGQEESKLKDKKGRSYSVCVRVCVRVRVSRMCGPFLSR